MESPPAATPARVSPFPTCPSARFGATRPMARWTARAAGSSPLAQAENPIVIDVVPVTVVGLTAD